MKRASAVALLALATASAPGPADWPQWRGPNGTGVSDGVFKDTWTPDTVAWKVPIPGRGHSTPVIAGNQIFLTTAIPTGRGPSATSRVSGRPANGPSRR